MLIEGGEEVAVRLRVRVHAAITPLLCIEEVSKMKGAALHLAGMEHEPLILAAARRRTPQEL
jgi:hypothetical protein